MISENAAIIRALYAMSKIFGVDFIRNNTEHKPMAKCYDGDTFIFWIGFAGSKERPDLVPDYKGWTIDATAEVNMVTGEAEVTKYALPDGTRYRKTT